MDSHVPAHKESRGSKMVVFVPPTGPFRHPYTPSYIRLIAAAGMGAAIHYCQKYCN